MKLKLLFICAILLISNFLSTAAGHKTQSAEDHIKALKQGVLLVRLSTQESKIKALRSIGKHAEADKVQQEQFLKNQRIYRAFKKSYTFSPVYFFYNTDTDKVLLCELGQVLYTLADGTVDFDKASVCRLQGMLLNENLERDSSITVESKHIYIAEFSNLERADSGEPDKPGASATNQEFSSFTALRILDKNMKQLSSPFPYYVRTFSTFDPFRRTEVQVVQKMNDRLKKFYSAVRSRVR